MYFVVMSAPIRTFHDEPEWEILSLKRMLSESVILMLARDETLNDSSAFLLKAHVWMTFSGKVVALRLLIAFKSMQRNTQTKTAFINIASFYK